MSGFDEQAGDTREELGDLTIVGSVHVSQESIEEVRDTIESESPEVVAVELGLPRLTAYFENQSQEDETPPSFLEAFRADANMKQYTIKRSLWEVQSRLAAQSGLSHGEGDMQAAVDTSVELDKDLALIDRSEDETMNRFLDMVSKYELAKLFGSVVVSLSKIMVQDTSSIISGLEGDDQKPVEELLHESERFFPSFYEVYIEERNIFLADSLRKLREAGYDTVAIIGRGHEPAVREMLDDTSKLESARSDSGISGEAVLIDWEKSSIPEE